MRPSEYGQSSDEGKSLCTEQSGKASKGTRTWDRLLRLGGVPSNPREWFGKVGRNRFDLGHTNEDDNIKSQHTHWHSKSQYSWLWMIGKVCDVLPVKFCRGTNLNLTNWFTGGWVSSLSSPKHPNLEVLLHLKLMRLF